MREYLNILKRTKIFEGLADDEILSVLACLSTTVKNFKKNTLIYSEGDTANFIGIIISGEVQTQKIDFSGNANIVSTLYAADLIAAVASYTADRLLPFDVLAASDVEVLCLNNSCLVRTCCKACLFHTKIIENMLRITAEKNLRLSAKIDILTKRTIREKIISFLYSQSKKSKGERFTVNMSRRQMAEYLSVNRSALSRELCKMQNEGLLEFKNNSFRLKPTL